MNNTSMLNSEGKYMLARMGHRDLLAITDAGFNIPKNVETVDLALLPNIPTLMQVLDAVLLETPIEAIYLAEEIKELSPEILSEYEKRLPGIEFIFMPHVPDFDNMVGKAKGAMRSGQYGNHAPNCVLRIGCPY